MALTQRIYRLFQADLHGVLDRLEEPEVLLKQALREMEEELERVELALKQLSRETNAVASRQEELSVCSARTEQELELCFQADNEALARTLLRRKLEMEKLSNHLARKHEELQTRLREQRAELAQNRSHYESVRQKAELLAEEHPMNTVVNEVDPGWRAQEFAVRDEEVDIALLQEKQRRARQGRETP